MHVINSAAATYQWHNVSEYDYTFRQLMSEYPGRSWAKTYLQGWNLIMRDVISKDSNNTGGSKVKDNSCWLLTKVNAQTQTARKTTVVLIVANGDTVCMFARNIKPNKRVTAMMVGIMPNLMEVQLILKLINLIVDIPQLYHSHDLTNVVTPVNPELLKKLLLESSYDNDKTQFLYQGFKEGFSIGYNGPVNVKLTSPNLRIRVGSPIILWNKIMKEVKLGHFAGPFEQVPFDNFIQLPVGLVPKDKGHDVRLIFHLSYPRVGKNSINANTDSAACMVQYCDFNEAINCVWLSLVENRLYILQNLMSKVRSEFWGSIRHHGVRQF